jgi:hypothetical protein
LNNRTETDEPRWENEPGTEPGTPRAKEVRRYSDRIVRGPGVYSEIYEALGPIVIRTSKY